jgi:hypothetical protein
LLAVAAVVMVQLDYQTKQAAVVQAAIGLR